MNDTKSETPRVQRLMGPTWHICYTQDHVATPDRRKVSLVDEKDLRTLELELAAARREVEELKRDKERLDWLEHTNYSLNWDDDNVWIIWDGQKAYCGNLHGNIRTAFDYAMDNEMKEEK